MKVVLTFREAGSKTPCKRYTPVGIYTVDHFIAISNVPDSFAISLVEGAEDEIREYFSRSETLTDYEIIDTFNVPNDRISIVESADAPGHKYERTNTLCVQAV